jgi:hypothetical protein
MLMVTMLAQMPDLRHKVMADHVSDDYGYCRDCRNARWPCELYDIAAKAQQIGANQRRGRHVRVTA